MRVLRAAAALAALAVIAGCSTPPQEPLKLEGNVLTVDNRSPQDWNGVEIWLNTFYRVTTSSIPAGGRFQVPLDAFVAGFGQRFDFRRAQIRDLRLVAKQVVVRLGGAHRDIVEGRSARIFIAVRLRGVRRVAVAADQRGTGVIVVR